AISDQSGQNCLTFIFFDHAGLASAPGATSTASITKTMQPTKSWSGAMVAVHGAPPFTFPVRRSDFFGTALVPSLSDQMVSKRAAKRAERAAPTTDNL